MKNMMDEILFIVPTDEIGGAEQMVKQLALNYNSKGKVVTVVCLTQKTVKNGWGDYPGKIKYINSSNIFIGYILLVFYLFNKKFDLAFSSQVYINGLLGFLRKFRWSTFRRLIVRESTSVFLRFKGFRLWTYNILYKVGYKETDLIICQTELMKEQLISNFTALKSHKVKVIDNPINLEDITSKSNLKLENGAIGDNTIVALGRMIPAKGFDILIASFNNMLKTNPELKLLILGDGSERAKLNTIIDKFHLEEKVIMPGYSQNPFPYLKRAKVCVVSSLIEGFPNILLQMMALNNNVVSTKCAGGIQEIKGVNISEVNDVDSLSDAISIALKDDDSEKNRQLFDQYLNERSVNNFILKMENE